MTRLARWRERWHADKVEHDERHAARHGHCVMCALSGWQVTATHGRLCDRHFREVEFPRIEL